MDDFQKRAAADTIFTQFPFDWESKSSVGFCYVGIDFMEMGGGYLHQLQGHCFSGGLAAATMAGLALGKGIAWVGLKKQKYLDSLD